MASLAPNSVYVGDPVDEGVETNKLIPFWYNFVSELDDFWDRDKAANNLTGIGFTVGPGQFRRHPIRLDADYNFLLQGVKYTVYYFDQQNSQYLWYEPFSGFGLEISDYQTQIGTPLTHWIDVSLSVSPSDRFIYGQSTELPNRSVQTGGLLPVPLDALQGYDYGWGQLQTPYFLPHSGAVLVQARNKHTVKSLVIGGALYGYKIAL